MSDDPLAPRTPPPHPSPSDSETIPLGDSSPSPSMSPSDRETIAQTPHDALSSSWAHHSTIGAATSSTAPSPAKLVAILFPAEERPPPHSHRAAIPHTPRGSTGAAAPFPASPIALRPAEGRRNATTMATTGKSCRRNTIANTPTGVARQDKAQIAAQREELAQARTEAHEADLRHGKEFADFQRAFLANQKKFKGQAKSIISKKNKVIEALMKKVQASEGSGTTLLAENAGLKKANRTKDEQISSLEERTTFLDASDAAYRNSALITLHTLKNKCDLQVAELLSLAIAAAVREEQTQATKTAAAEAERAHKELADKHSVLEGQFADLERATKLKSDEVHSLTEAAHKFKREVAASTKELSEKHVSLEQDYQRQIAASNNEGVQALARHHALVKKYQALEDSSEKLAHAATPNSDEVHSLEEAARKFKIEADQSSNELKEKNISLEHSVKVLQTEATERQELHAKEVAVKRTQISELQSSNEILHTLLDEERIASDRLQSEVKRLVPNATAVERHQKDAAANRAKLRSKVEEIALLTKEKENLQGQVSKAHENSNIKQEQITFLMKIVRKTEASDDKEDDKEIIELLSSDDEFDEGKVGAGNTAVKRINTPTVPSGSVDKHGATPMRGSTQVDSARRSRRKSKAPVPFDPCKQEVRRLKEEPGDSSKKAQASARVGRKSRNQNTEGSSREVKSASVRSGEVKFGDVGYQFKRYFPEYTQSYEGEVIEILGNYMRRCRYTDGSIEDYRLADMRQKCEPR